MAENALDACCSRQFCTCKETPGLPCGKDADGLEITVEFTSDLEGKVETSNKNDSDNSGSHKCSTPEQLCCVCGKPIKYSPAIVETPEPLGCGLEDCDTEFCTAQDLPCENMEEPAADDENAAEASDTPEEKRPSEVEESAIDDDDAAEEQPPDETETAEVPEPEEGSERKSASSNPEPENADGKNETGPSEELPTGAKKPCCCKSKKDPPPE